MSPNLNFQSSLLVIDKAKSNKLNVKISEIMPVYRYQSVWGILLLEKRFIQQNSIKYVAKCATMSDFDQNYIKLFISQKP